MPVLYINSDEKYDCLKKEPYLTFTRNFNEIKDDIKGKEFKILLGDGKNDENFKNGFFTNELYYKNLSLNFKFTNTESFNAKDCMYFTRVTFSCEYDCEDAMTYHLKNLQEFKLRVPYIYIPNASYFDFSFQLHSYKLDWDFDLLIQKVEDIPQACYSLISNIISTFAFAD